MAGEINNKRGMAKERISLSGIAALLVLSFRCHAVVNSVVPGAVCLQGIKEINPFYG